MAPHGEAEPGRDAPAWGTPPASAHPPEPGREEPGREDWPAAYPEQSQALLVFVLGLVGLFVFQLVAPAAWIIGRQEVRAVDRGLRDPRNRGLAQAGQIMGIIGTVLLGLALLALVIVFVVFVAASTSLLRG